MANEKILVVEDEGIIAEDLSERLRSLGYTVMGIADTGEKAVAMATELRPDFILMDIRLKGKMDGIEAARIIADKLAVPFIFMTAHADDPTLQKAKLVRPTGYLLKPVDNNAQIRSAIEIGLYRFAREKKLRESEQWLNTTLKSMDNGVIATDGSCNVVFMNPAACMLTGISAQQASGTYIDRVFDVRDFNTEKKIAGIFERALADDSYRTNKGSAILRSRDGYEIPVDYIASPIRDDEGHRSGILVVFNDISDKIKVEEALQIGERKYRSIIDACGECIISVDADNIVTFANGNIASLLGYPARLIVGQPILAFLGTESASVLPGMLIASNRGFLQRCELELKRKDGARAWATFTISLISGKNGAYAGALIMASDITEQKAKEKELKDALARANLHLDLMDQKVSDLQREMLACLKSAGDILDERGSIDVSRRHVVDRPVELLNTSMTLMSDIRKLRADREMQP
jgi:PAS domain S-box-containing protein